MRISIIGTGYVGLITGACLADLGHEVTCVDVIKEKVDMINSAKAPIYEEGLGELLKKNIGKKLTATLDLANTIKNSEITFIAVGTPSADDGSTDLKYIESAAAGIGKGLQAKNSYHVIVIKSTVPPKTTELVGKIIEKESRKKQGKDFGLAMNPEFLREGTAVYDFMNPDRIVIGAVDQKSFEAVKELYSHFNCPIVKTELRTAEMVKYASNAFLATKITFSNEIGNACKKLGIDTYEVMNAVGMDKRIGRAFLNSGIGYQGSCFPKDVKSLIHTIKQTGIEPKILNAVVEVNDKQPFKLLDLSREKVGSLKGKKISILGLAFKPDSDDMRESASIRIIKKLVEEGALIKAYDPAAMENAKKVIKEKIEYAASLEEALSFSDIVFILTDWKEFKNENLYKGKAVFDGRHVLNKKSDQNYEGICW